MGNLARKASELILETSGRWLNLDPRIPIRVGEYGEIDHDTGRFIQLGNIYESDAVKEVIPDVANYPPLLGEIAQEEKLKTEQASSWSFDLDPKVSVTNIIDGSIQLHFDVAPGQRAAYLLTKTSRTDYLPTDHLLKKLSKVKDLVNMYLVTERTICYGYSFGITTVGSSNISSKVDANIPLPTGAPVTVGGSAAFGYKGNSTIGWSTNGDKEDFAYVATLTMKRMNPDWKHRLLGTFSHRGAVPEVADDELWVDAAPPWAPLNVDGDEDLPEDEVI